MKWNDIQRVHAFAVFSRQNLKLQSTTSLNGKFKFFISRAAMAYHTHASPDKTLLVLKK